MKRILSTTIVLALVNINLILLISCATVEQTIYLGDVFVDAPIVPPPAHIDVNKDVGNVTISPKFSILTSGNKINSATDDHFTRSFNFGNDSTYKAKDKNLEWNITRILFGADIDIKVSENISLFGGFHFSSGDQKSLTGGNFGIGLHNHMISPVVRLDLGVTFQKYEYLAVTIVHTKTTAIWGESLEYWDIYGDKGSSTNINPFLSLTINSFYDSSLINWYVPAGFFTQNLLGFKPGTTNYPLFPWLIEYREVDNRSDMLAGFIYLNPGISFNFIPQAKLLLSVRILKDILTTNSDEWFLMPSVQIDFRL